MRRIHYAFSGLKYHKKMSCLAVLIFSLFLIVTTGLLWLVQYQESRGQQLTTILKQLLPNSKIGSIIKTSSQALSGQYLKWHFGLLLLFLGVITLFFGFCLHLRKKEVRSFKLLNLSAGKIFNQFFIEVALALLMSLVIVAIILSLFSSVFINSLRELNQTQFYHQLPSSYSTTYTHEYTEEQSESFALTPYELNSYTISSNTTSSVSAEDQLIRFLCFNTLFLTAACVIGMLLIRVISPKLLH